MVENNLVKLEDFREDVREYLQDLKPNRYYSLKIEDNGGEVPKFILVEYHSHKANLSEICGWDAGEDYNQELFDSSLEYVIRRMDL